MKKALSLIWLILLLVGCGSNNCNVVPDVPFDVTFSRADALDAFTPNGSAYIRGGSAGLIVHNMSDHGGAYNFIAYDRCSPINPQERNPVIIVNSFIAEDPVSGAQWLLVDGSPTKIAECPLRAYRVGSFGNTYTIRN